MTGRDEGSVNGTGFRDFENLTGSADNEDTFVFETAAASAGWSDGGEGGFDSLVISGGSYATGDHHVSPDRTRGSIDLDGKYDYLRRARAGVTLDVHGGLDVFDLDR